jgi:hypothetical protein
MPKEIRYTSLAGYAHCACRDCFNIVIDGDGKRRTYCDDCDAVGCPARGSESECRAPGAYGQDSAAEEWVNVT